jgi:hypothetical protein
VATRPVWLRFLVSCIQSLALVAVPDSCLQRALSLAVPDYQDGQHAQLMEPKEPRWTYSDNPKIVSLPQEVQDDSFSRTPDVTVLGVRTPSYLRWTTLKAGKGTEYGVGSSGSDGCQMLYRYGMPTLFTASSALLHVSYHSYLWSLIDAHLPCPQAAFLHRTFLESLLSA